LKPRFPSWKPARANGALFPALCALALALLAAMQLLLTGPARLPDETGPRGGGVRAAMPEIRPGAVDPVLRAAPIFTPGRTMAGSEHGVSAGADGAGAGSGLPGGWQLAGSVSVRGRAYAIVQDAAGRVIRLAPGGRIAGARLVSLSADGAVFVSGGQRMSIPFGATAGNFNSYSPDEAADSEEESE
jgi:hypothetical protein